MNPVDRNKSFSRREMLCRLGGGFGALALGSVFSQAGLLSAMAGPSQAASAGSAFTLNPKPPHFAPKATRIIFLFMNGGPSHVDTFDPKLRLPSMPDKALMRSRTRPGAKKGEG